MKRGLEAHGQVRRGPDFTLRLQLSVPPGRTVALVGPNGAGKSTAVAALAGLAPLVDGRITLDGRLLDDPDAGTFVAPEARHVGVVFQDPLLFPHMTALENVAFGLRSRGVPRGAARETARTWLARVGLEEAASRKPGTLSGGQAQRVALARALAPEPGLLLLDEPLSALDVRTRGRLRHLLRDHLERFTGPRLLITHDPAEAFELGDEIHVLEDGEVTQSGLPDEIRMRPRTPYAAELGGSNFFTGTAADGSVRLDGLTLAIADRDVAGPVRVSIRPSAIAVHREPPGGSPRNRWSTRVERIQEGASRVRLLAGSPLPLMIEITPAARRELAIEPGREVWLSIKATDIGIERNDGGL